MTTIAVTRRDSSWWINIVEKSGVHPYKLLWPGKGAKKGEKSFQINQEIKTLLAQKALNTITEMKNASRTGATGFGAMNEKELGLIEADIASLDPRLSDTAFEASLNRIKKRMQKVMSQIDITEQDRLSLQQEEPLGIL